MRRFWRLCVAKLQHFAEILKQKKFKKHGMHSFLCYFVDVFELEQLQKSAKRGFAASFAACFFHFVCTLEATHTII